MCKKTSDGFIIHVKVEPCSSRSAITERIGHLLKVKIKSPPIKGKANKELIEMLARKFGVKKTDVNILSGKKSKNKVIKIKRMM